MYKFSDSSCMSSKMG